MNKLDTKFFIIPIKLGYSLLFLLVGVLISPFSLGQPTAVLDVGGEQNINYPVCFDGSDSKGDSGDLYAEHGEIVNFIWDFGDGTAKQQGEYLNTQTHAYQSEGTYTATLQVIDDQGASDSISKIITVGTLPKITVSGNTTSAIKSAIGSLGGQPGIVFIPAGTYTFSELVSVPTGVIIEGAGSDKTKIKTVGVKDQLFWVTGNNVRFTGVSLEGYSRVSTQTSNRTFGIIAYTRRKNLYIDHCELSGFITGINPKYGSSATVEYCNIHHNNMNGYGYGISLADDSYVMIRYNEFSNNRHSLTSGGTGAGACLISPTRIDFIMNHLQGQDDVEQKGPGFDTHAGVYGRVRIDFNTFEDMRGAIALRDGNNVFIRGNVFRNIDPNEQNYLFGNSILLRPTYCTGGHAVNGGTKNVFISGNTFINSNSDLCLERIFTAADNIWANGRLMTNSSTVTELNIDWTGGPPNPIRPDETTPLGLLITTSSLPLGLVGQDYGATVQASNGTLPYQWGSADLPGGFTLDSSSGVMSGTPTSIEEGGSTVKEYNFTIDVEDAENKSASKSFTLTVRNPVDIARGIVTMDGSLGEYSSTGVSFSDSSGRGNNQDNSALAKFLWDNTHLYIGVKVTDTDLTTTISTNDDPKIYDDDNIEIFIDPQGDGGSTAQSSDYRFTINSNGNLLDGSSWTTWTWNSNILRNVNSNNSSDSEGGYTLEVAIPWDDLGITPSVGQVLGLQLGVTDRDTGSGYEFFGWPLTDVSFNNPEEWAKVILSEVDNVEFNSAPLAAFNITPSDLIVNFDSSGSSDPDGDEITCDWDFGDGQQSSGEIVDHNYAESGTYEVILTVNDARGMKTTLSKSVDLIAPVTNNAPLASFEMSHDNLTVLFDSSGSSDPDGDEITRQWDFGDGQQGSGEIVQHTFNSEGTYEVSLTVNDTADMSSNISKSVVVLPLPIKIVQTNGLTTINGDLSEFPLSATASFSDDSGRTGDQDNSAVAKVMWDSSNLYIGLEITDSDLTGMITTNDDPAIYNDDNIEIFIDPDADGGNSAQENDYRFTINLKDSFLDGQAWNSWSWNSNIETQSSMIGSLNSSGDTDSGYTLEVAIPWDDLGITPSVGQVLGLQLGVTDRDTGSGYEFFGWPLTDVSFNNPSGWAKIILGGSGPDPEPNLPPIATFNITSDNLNVNFDSSGSSSDPEGGEITCDWNFGDGSQDSGEVVEHTFSNEGTYEVTLTVNDAGGLNTSLSKSVSVVLDPLPEIPIKIVQTSQLPVINGDLSEFPLSIITTFSDSSGRGSNLDNSAEAKVMWDSTNLYIGVEITDTDLTSTVNTNDDTNIYSDDNLEIFIDPQGDGGSSAQNNDYRFTINLNDNVLDGNAWTNWSWNSNIETKVSTIGSLNSGDDTDSGYTVEVAIPWSNLGVSPTIGQVIGLQIGVTDRDLGSDYEFFGWPLTDVTFNNPDGWEKVILVGPQMGASINWESPSYKKEGTYPLTLITSENAAIIPFLEFKEGDGTTTTIDLTGSVPGTEFAGTLKVDDSTAQGLGILEVTIEDEDGDSSNSNVVNGSIIVDKTPPPAPTGLRTQ